MYRIEVIWRDGEREFLKCGASPDNPPAEFPARKEADDMVGLMREGMADDCQSISVVLAPTGKAAPTK